MTPFGVKLRTLRREKKITQRQLAKALGVSPAYLSALENGQRGRPSWPLVQKIITYFGAIWDDAEEIEGLARLSHPRITIDTSNLSPEATELANRLAETIQRLEDKDIRKLLKTLNGLLQA